MRTLRKTLAIHSAARAASSTGVGISSGMSPASLSSAHSADGIGVAIHRAHCSASSAERAPGMTEETAGWPNGNCNVWGPTRQRNADCWGSGRLTCSAAAPRGTPCLAQTAWIATARSTISDGASP